MLKCDICDWKTREKRLLSAHRKRMHGVLLTNIKCNECYFETGKLIEIDNHKSIKHSNKASVNTICNEQKEDDSRKRVISCFKCTETNCESTFDSEQKLQDHNQNQHASDKVLDNILVSADNSPPRKKPLFIEGIIDMAMDIDENILSEDFVGQVSLLNEEINKLKTLNEVLRADKSIIEQELETTKVQSTQKDDQNKQLRNENNKLKADLVSKHSKCDNCENNSQGKQDLNKHSVSVQEGHKEFLRGFKSIVKAKPDGACLFNCTSLHIYGDESKSVDIRKSVNAHIYKNWSFYRNKVALPFTETVITKNGKKVIKCDTEEEFLAFILSEDSNKAFSNFLEIIALSNILDIKINIFTYGKDIPKPRWTEIVPNAEIRDPINTLDGKSIDDMYLYHSNDNHFDLLLPNHESQAKDKEKRDSVHLMGNNSYDEIDMEELDDEKTELSTEKNDIHKCNQCESVFSSKHQLLRHFSQIHEDVDEWNCNDCDYQANNSSSLMNHLKLTKHQPSEGNVKSISNIWKCNNCEQEFTTYPSLMKHRKNEHNQTKVCKYFLDNKCNFSADVCWYQHSHQEKQQSKFKCKHCEIEFPDLNLMMLHKKKEHNQTVKCKYYLNGTCKKSSEACWFLHNGNNEGNRQVFQMVSNHLPPDRMDQMMMGLISKMEALVSQIAKNTQ